MRKTSKFFKKITALTVTLCLTLGFMPAMMASAALDANLRIVQGNTVSGDPTALAANTKIKIGESITISLARSSGSWGLSDSAAWTKEGAGAGAVDFGSPAAVTTTITGKTLGVLEIRGTRSGDWAQVEIEVIAADTPATPPSRDAAPTKLAAADVTLGHNSITLKAGESKNVAANEFTVLTAAEFTGLGANKAEREKALQEDDTKVVWVAGDPVGKILKSGLVANTDKDLAPRTKYNVYIRVKETDAKPASKFAVTSFTTAPPPLDGAGFIVARGELKAGSTLSFGLDASKLNALYDVGTFDGVVDITDVNLPNVFLNASELPFNYPIGKIRVEWWASAEYDMDEGKPVVVGKNNKNADVFAKPLGTGLTYRLKPADVLRTQKVRVDGGATGVIARVSFGGCSGAVFSQELGKVVPATPVLSKTALAKDLSDFTMTFANVKAPKKLDNTAGTTTYAYVVTGGTSSSSASAPNSETNVLKIPRAFMAANDSVKVQVVVTVNDIPSRPLTLILDTTAIKAAS